MIIEALIILFSCVALLAPALNCGLVVDDENMVNSLKTVRDRKWKKLHWGDLNPITYGAGFFSTSTYDHLFNVIVHCVNSLLVYKLTGSFMASLLWAINPVNNQLSIWLNGRRYALSILIILLALNWKILFAALYPAALWLHILATPTLLLLIGTAWWPIIPLVVVVAWKRVFKRLKYQFEFRKSAFSKNNELQKIRPEKLVLYVKTLAWNFWHILNPIPKMHHDHLFYFGRYEEDNKKGYSLNFEFWKGIAIVAFLAYEIIVARNFWALWFVLFMSQWCMICNVTMNVADRYCSLPAIGLMMVFVKYVSFLPMEWQFAIYAGLMTVYMLRYFRLFRAYHSIGEFYEYHLDIDPANVEARRQFAAKVIFQNPYKAFVILKDGIRHRPKDFTLLVAMTNILAILGFREKALKVLAVAEKRVPIGEEEDSKEVFDAFRKQLTPPSPNRFERRHGAKNIICRG